MTDRPQATLHRLSPEDEALIQSATARVSRERMADRLRRIVDLPSPTGEELPLARLLADELTSIGCATEVQEIDGQQGNAVGRLKGGGNGVDLLLYAPIDTAFSGNPDEDAPWLGRQPRPDLSLPARIDDGKVIGLGAENPKSYIACILEVVDVLAASGAELPGTLVAGFAGGGMPTSGRPGLRPNIGHGVGCAHMIEHGVRPDYAIIVKPGYAVSWEEVGLTWHTIEIRGALNYAGIRHRVPYRNPIVASARVIDALERWFPDYTARHTDGLVAPQGSIDAIRAGGPDLSAYVPPVCELFVDIRVSPRSSPAEVRAELGTILDEIRRDLPDFEITSEMTIAIEGTSTPETSWIVRSLIRAWEAQEGRAHEPARGASGATDAAILRAHGIETARIGPPPPSTPSPYPGFSMGVADLSSMETLVSVLVRAAVDTIGRPRSEVA
ncbi:MAG TPA: M20/M25/M40 family metallo-hydrolase [Candidatus Limnocylindrales bacterium]|nr:M20/M25/M40 family metallo-hydrolase [Candidatus Limnocylindrales bacterium]